MKNPYLYLGTRSKDSTASLISRVVNNNATGSDLVVMKIAYQAHKEQKDKSGLPYIFHPFHFAEQMDSQEAVIIALLHDVIEDSIITIDDLKNKGFPEDCIEAVKILTHSEEKDYFEYINDIKKSNNPYVRAVKLADLKHNSDITRLDVIDKKALKRIEKYKTAIAILQ